MGRAVDQLLSLAAVRVEGYTRVVNGRTVQVSSYIRGGGKGWTPPPTPGPPAARINDIARQPENHPNIATSFPTQAERDALRFYGGDGYEEINENLRHGEAISPEVAEHRDNMFTLMSRGRTKEPMTLYRMASASLDMKVGEDFKDNGFISTAHGDDSDVMEEFNENSPGLMYMTIDVPAGTPVIDFDHGFGRSMGEAEVILPPGSTFEVLSYEKQTGPTAIEQKWPAVRVHLRMVPHDA